MEFNKMTDLAVKVFPVGAVLFSIFACMFPGTLSGLGFLIIPLLGLIMLSMGATLSTSDFINAAKKPKFVFLGMFLQFTLMPAFAWVTGKILQLPQEQFIGLVMVGCVAGGTASNVITYLAGGDVALSITMTACSTAAGVFITPLVSSFLLGKMVHVPALQMFNSIIFVVAVPVTVGLIINKIFRKQRSVLEKICPIVSVAAIIFVIGIIVSLNVKTLYSCGALVIAAVFVHNALGMGAGYFCAKLLKCDHKTAVTIAIEVGMQNSGLAAALSGKLFGAASALPGAIFSIWHNISGAVFASFSRRMIKKQALFPTRVGKGK